MTRRPRDVAAAAIVVTSVSALAGLAEGQDTPAAIIAAQIRTQGYSCTEPVTAERDVGASAPNSAVWIVGCANARYRVRLVPDMAAQVTRLE